MAVEHKISYHCSFLLNQEGGGVKLGIAWRRVGNCDYGVYLCTDSNPMSVMFKATYSSKGEIESFLVSDKLIRPEEAWDDDHLRYEENPPQVEAEDVRILNELSNAFVEDWLESFGASTTAKMLKDFCNTMPQQERRKGLRPLLDAELPIQIKPDRLMDLLAVAEMTENKFLYVFLPYSTEQASIDAQPLLEQKMRLFFELI